MWCVWCDQKYTRVATGSVHMEQPKVDKWLDQNRTRGSTWSRHMAPPEPDMWRDQKTTRGAAGSRHMASWEGDTWLCQRGSSWRQLPAWHGATSAASMARCHVSCQRGACHVAASSMTKLMTICISHRRKAVSWRITCSSLEKTVLWRIWLIRHGKSNVTLPQWRFQVRH